MSPGRFALRAGVRGKILGTIVVHLLLLAFVLTVFHTLRLWKAESQELQTRGRLLAETMADLAQIGLRSRDSRALSWLAESVREQQDVVYAGISDDQGVILAHAADPEIGNFLGRLVLPGGEVLPHNPAVTPISVGGRAAFHVLWPIIPAPQELLEQDLVGPATEPTSVDGYVFVGVGTRGLWQTVWRELIVSLGITLLLSGLAILVATVFSQILIDPLLELVEASRRIAEGDLDVRTLPRSDDEIGDLCASFNLMAQRLDETHRTLQDKTRNLQKANEELESFVSSVSHDLKAPLISLEGYISYLKEEYGTKLDETARTYIGRIEANTQKMGALVKDLLELSRIGRLEESFSEIDVQELLQDVLIQLRPQLDQRDGQVVTTTPLPRVFFERNRLSQVFANLIDNAIKYCSAERRPTIEIAHTELDGYHHFSVRDNGIGIAQEYQDRVFGMFVRLHSDAEFEGTGMGLAIVKKTLETYGGSIWFESEEGVGSTFHFLIPNQTTERGRE